MDLRAERLEQVAGPLRVIDGLSDIEQLAALDGYRPAAVDAARRMLAGGTDPLQISGALADAVDALTGRLLALAEAALGEPPCAYAWLALGSQGRGELVLSSDQDSAIAIDDDAEPGALGYFHKLAGLVVPALARAGLPLCDGGYMADTWCRRLADYAAMFRDWTRQPEPEALLRAEVFLDVRPVHGLLPAAALEGILVAGGARGQFIIQLARAAVTFRPPLRAFGRLPAAGSSIDLKRGGTAAVVLLARLYALAAQSTARSTVQRLDDAAAAGTLSPPGARDLIESYRTLTGLRLRHQVEQARSGRPADNSVRLDDLTVAQRQHLREALRVVRHVQDATDLRFSTSSVT